MSTTSQHCRYIASSGQQRTCRFRPDRGGASHHAHLVPFQIKRSWLRKGNPWPLPNVARVSPSAALHRHRQQRPLARQSLHYRLVKLGSGEVVGAEAGVRASPGIAAHCCASCSSRCPPSVHWRHRCSPAPALWLSGQLGWRCRLGAAFWAGGTVVLHRFGPV